MYTRCWNKRRNDKKKFLRLSLDTFDGIESQFCKFHHKLPFSVLTTATLFLPSDCHTHCFWIFDLFLVQVCDVWNFVCTANKQYIKMIQKLPLEIRKTIMNVLIFCFPNQNDIHMPCRLTSKSRVVADLPFSYSKF